MARMVNAVIGKKNKTWCDNFMLEAMPTLRRITAPIPGAIYSLPPAVLRITRFQKFIDEKITPPANLPPPKPDFYAEIGKNQNRDA